MYKIDRRGGVQKSYTRTDPTGGTNGKPSITNVSKNFSYDLRGLSTGKKLLSLSLSQSQIKHLRSNQIIICAR